MIKTAIVEDNKRLSAEIVEFIGRVPGFSVEVIAGTVAEAIEFINLKKPDLLVLDVELPDGSAFTILEKTLHLHYNILFLTAFEQYAIQAIKFGALDYLIKPLDEKELHEALVKISKVYVEKEQIKIAVEAYEKSKSNRLVLHTNNHFQIVNLEDIMYCRSDNGYTTFYLADKRQVLISKYLKEYDDLLPETDFLRSHQSFLVNKRFIDSYHTEGYLILKDKTEIPVAFRKREAIMEFLRGKV